LRTVAAGVIGSVVTAVAVFVAVGMLGGADPEFSKGRSPAGSVIVQEIIGALALATLGLTIRQLVLVARGKHAGRLVILLPLGFVLALVWWFALLVERAS
jgi:integral membrane sensor domain MASE1